MNLFRAFATVGGYTLASRVLGFVRDILIAGTLGAGPVADAFFVAFKLPNFFRRLFAEGAFSAGFVPLFSDLLANKGAGPARAFAEPSKGAKRDVRCSTGHVYNINVGVGDKFINGLMRDSAQSIVHYHGCFEHVRRAHIARIARLHDVAK